MIRLRRPASENRLPGGWPAVAAPFLWLLGLGAWIATHRRALPEWIPVHWSLTGIPSRWIRPTPAAVLALLAEAGGLCLVLTVLAWGTLRSARWIAPDGPRGVAERLFRRQVAGMVLISEYFLGFTPALSLLPLPEGTFLLWTALFWATLITCVVSLTRARRRIREIGRPPRGGAGQGPRSRAVSGSSWLFPAALVLLAGLLYAALHH